MEEKLLYDSKGCSQKIIVRYVISGIVCLAVGILFFCVSEARYDKLTSGGFSIGGGYKFTKESRNFLKIAGSVGIAFGFWSISIICTLRSMCVKIYEDHIEGKSWVGILRENKQFFCTTAELQSYEVSNVLPFPVVLKTPSGNHKIICQDSEKACAALQTIIKNK